MMRETSKGVQGAFREHAPALKCRNGWCEVRYVLLGLIVQIWASTSS